MQNAMDGIRDHFNQNSYSDASHAEVMRQMTAQNGASGYKIGELPIFLPASLVQQMAEGGKEIIAQAMKQEVIAAMEKHVPERFRLQNPPAHPSFVLVDYAITKDAQGNLAPRVIEFQAATAHFAWLADAAQTYKDVYGLGDAFKYAIAANDRDAYDAQIRDAIVGPHNPKNVALVEIDPWNQDTRMDFVATQRMLGIAVVDVAEIIKQGDRLYYIDDKGDLTRINRIYSRVVADEFDAKGMDDKVGFKFTDKLDVEWAGDLVWQHRMSKAALPFIDHPLSPKATLLSDLKELPADLDKYVLKPLFFHGGQGVKVDITKSDIDAIPAKDRDNWMLMEKVTYAPFQQTPDQNLKSGAEVRILFTWDDKNGLQPAIMMGRSTAHKLANLAYNKAKFLGLSPVFAVDEKAASKKAPVSRAP